MAPALALAAMRTDTATPPPGTCTMASLREGSSSWEYLLPEPSRTQLLDAQQATHAVSSTCWESPKLEVKDVTHRHRRINKD